MLISLDSKMARGAPGRLLGDPRAFAPAPSPPPSPNPSAPVALDVDAFPSALATFFSVHPRPFFPLSALATHESPRFPSPGAAAAPTRPVRPTRGACTAPATSRARARVAPIARDRRIIFLPRLTLACAPVAHR
tara:strand:+ start:3282 stop:3683 length:402 start_codon:yes stop_codon:yes gene_type:complete